MVSLRREELDLRQSELAELAGCSTRFVHAVETGKPTLQLDKLLAVLRVLGLHLALERGQRNDAVTVGPELAGLYGLRRDQPT
ncbi:helix-turn-helix domain-containing protein [Solicola gregarius]|uniref:Helix-turn-helix domain-containing protein n=1 Tax=Solicola gregarius TaxID=2908642 RepID=A0AA46YKN6_9ACTN|nr:helix-turn-helix domain-containing protein [Solicola gregarius]UYM04676.1 helix-turn-helix domain-containing protein [Solicola gregarius]